MTLQQLQYLLEVQRAGSISGAAKTLYTLQPSISKAISAVEDELGFAVFIRSSTGVTPTTQGIQVLVQAARICELYRQMTQVKHATQQKLRIGGTQHAVMSTVFNRLVEELGDRGIFSLHRRDDPLAGLTMFELDLCIVIVAEGWIRNYEYKLLERNLKWETLSAVPSMLYIGPGHRLYHQETVTPWDLREDRIVGTASQQSEIENHMRDQLNVDPNRVMIVDDRLLRFRLVEQGQAYLICARQPRQVREQHGLREIPLGRHYQFLVVTNPLCPLSGEGRRFVELLREELQQLKR